MTLIDDDNFYVNIFRSIQRIGNETTGICLIKQFSGFLLVAPGRHVQNGFHVVFRESGFAFDTVQHPLDRTTQGMPFEMGGARDGSESEYVAIGNGRNQKGFRRPVSFRTAELGR